MPRKTILVVEDEENLVELLKFRLEANGYSVETALDGEAGLNKIRELKPDLVLLDLMMPKINGYDVLRFVKASDDTKNIPVIVLTARGQQKDRDRAMNSGAESYIAKPFDPGELLKEIRRLAGG